MKATNPLMWEVYRDTLISDQRTATMQEHKQNEFKTNRLNIFLATNTGISIAPIENESLLQLSLTLAEMVASIF